MFAKSQHGCSFKIYFSFDPRLSPNPNDPDYSAGKLVNVTKSLAITIKQ